MGTRIRSAYILPALLVSLAAAALLAALPRLPERIAVRAGDAGPFLTDGETPQLRNFFGFNSPEADGTTRFRWTTGEGSFVVRNGMRLGEPLALRFRVCGCRLDSRPAPRLRVQANGALLFDTPATAHWGQWRRYSLLVPPRTAAYSPDLFIELLSDSVPHATTGEPLGIAFDRAELGPAVPQRAYSAAAALGLGLLIGGLALAGRARGLSMRTALLASLLALGLAAAQGLCYRSFPLPAGTLALALIASIGLALAPGITLPARAGLAAVLALPVLAVQLLGTWMLDDAFISFRYARNALLGHGFVFNVGERVEGYTNFLWTALFVAVLRAGADPAVASQAITLLLALAIIAAVWAGARHLAGTGPALAALALLAASTPFVLYTARGSGMETALFTLLTLAGVLLYGAGRVIEEAEPGAGPQPGQAARERPGTFASRLAIPGSGALLGLAAMTRPEGALVAGITGLHLLFSVWRAGHRARWELALFGAGFLAIFAPYYLWRYAYYGYPLPNTFYAKVGGTGAQVLRGFAYATGFALSQAPLVALALPGAVGGRRSSVVGCSPFTAYLALLITGYSAYIIAVGGDHFPYYRFFVPVMPWLALLAAAGLGRIGRIGGGRAAAPAIGLLTAIGLCWQAPQLYESRTLNAGGRVWSENSVVEKNRELGLWLREYTPPDALIATGIAGALPYYAERPVLDALGLNDVYIAHLDVPAIGQGVAGAEKTDVAYILGRRPAYIPYNSAGPFKRDPHFVSAYRLMILRGPEGRGMRLYRRADLPVPASARSADQEAAR